MRRSLWDTGSRIFTSNIRNHCNYENVWVADCCGHPVLLHSIYSYWEMGAVSVSAYADDGFLDATITALFCDTMTCHVHIVHYCGI